MAKTRTFLKLMHVVNIITTVLLKVNSCVLVALHVLIHILGFFLQIRQKRKCLNMDYFFLIR